MGTVHAAHEGDHILYDGCLRCDEHSKTLYDLDTSKLIQLGEIVKGERRADTLNENRAAHHLRLAKLLVERSGV